MNTSSLSCVHEPPNLANLLVLPQTFSLFSLHQSSPLVAAQQTKKESAIENEWKGIEGG